MKARIVVFSVFLALITLYLSYFFYFDGYLQKECSPLYISTFNKAMEREDITLCTRYVGPVRYFSGWKEETRCYIPLKEGSGLPITIKGGYKDECVFNLARKTRNITMCERITSNFMYDDCHALLGDIVIENCYLMKTNGGRNDCIRNVAALTLNSTLCDQLVGEYTKGFYEHCLRLSNSSVRPEI